jgi:hypothetical protein
MRHRDLVLILSKPFIIGPAKGPDQRPANPRPPKQPR